VLRQVLTERGVHILSPSAAQPYEGASPDISHLLKEADLVIGVLSRERRSDWVLFELGQAFALGRRLVLFTPPGTSRWLPVDLKRVLTVRSSITNYEAVSFAIDQLLAARAEASDIRSLPKPKITLGGEASDYIEEYKGAIHRQDWRALERVIEKALLRVGVEALSSEIGSDVGADLSVWSDELQASIGNPLLIEVKAASNRPADLRSAADQLARQVSLSGTRFGLLLYAAPAEVNLARHSLPPNVLAITVEKFFDRLRHASFAEVVNGLRNERMHGLS
jgi:hypothetical protein